MLLFTVPITQKLQGGQRDIDIMVLIPVVRENEVCHGTHMEGTQVTLCTTGLYPIYLQANSKTSLLGFKLYAGNSWLAWVRSSSYINVGVCDRRKDVGLGWLLGTLQDLTYKVCFPLQRSPQHLYATGASICFACWIHKCLRRREGEKVHLSV